MTSQKRKASPSLTHLVGLAFLVTMAADVVAEIDESWPVLRRNETWILTLECSVPWEAFKKKWHSVDHLELRYKALQHASPASVVKLITVPRNLSCGPFLSKGASRVAYRNSSDPRPPSLKLTIPLNHPAYGKGVYVCEVQYRNKDENLEKMSDSVKVSENLERFQLKKNRTISASLTPADEITVTMAEGSASSRLELRQSWLTIASDGGLVDSSRTIFESKGSAVDSLDRDAVLLYRLGNEFHSSSCPVQDSSTGERRKKRRGTELETGLRWRRDGREGAGAGTAVHVVVYVRRDLSSASQSQAAGSQPSRGAADYGGGRGRFYYQCYHYNCPDNVAKSSCRCRGQDPMPTQTVSLSCSSGRGAEASSFVHGLDACVKLAAKTKEADALREDSSVKLAAKTKEADAWERRFYVTMGFAVVLGGVALGMLILLIVLHRKLRGYNTLPPGIQEEKNYSPEDEAASTDQQHSQGNSHGEDTVPESLVVVHQNAE